MGKRKERRLAAKSNAGRRVKLDLFAEPPGDLGGSTEHDELGEDTKSKGHAGLPNSPSSSGQKPQNPLQLLGQYSDDSDDDSNQMLSNASVGNSSPENNHEVKSLLGESCQHLDTNAGEDLASQKVKQHGGSTNSAPQDCDQNMEDSDKRENDDLASSHLRTEVDLTEQVSAPESSGLQVIGDVSSGWKIVMHEESNSYYYWNTETGETSWEVPDVLAQETKLCDQKMLTVAGETDNVPVGTEESNLTSGVKLDGFSNSGTVDRYAKADPNGGHGSQMHEWNLECNNEATHDTMANEYQESGIDLSSRLVKRFEALLERLKSLQGSNEQQQGLNWISKYTLEVEIRLVDIKSLLSYGSSLLPFWMHSERQLEQLESAINDEKSKIVNYVQSNEAAANPSFSQAENNFQESKGYDSEQGRVGTPEDCHVTPNVDTLAIVSKDQEVQISGVNAEHVSAFCSPTRHTESGTSEQVNGVVVPNNSSTKDEFCAGEEVDMDVDMEVEESNPAENTTVAYALNAKEFAPPEEQPIHPSPPSTYASFVPEDTFTVPPPPDEEWIPPPPPDNEEVPPPPPDEPPPEHPYPPLPSYPETGQPSYAEQYNFSYPDPSFEYYGHTVTGAANINFYGHPEGGQAAIHAPFYYSAVPSTYTETAQVATKPVEAVTYYGLQDGTGPAAPVVSTVESLQFQSESAPLSYDNLASDQTGAINSFSGVGGSVSLPNVNIECSAVDSGTSGGSFEVPSTMATIQAAATISEKDTVSVPSTNSVPTTASIPATSVVTKVQSKVPRTKKRTAVSSSLRSNKKVSSLVDKWKAAKEELLEDEEEPQNAYELFERKRQRGIEEWYAQQINSGEAKDNANFQPLGGDWREKVKRRKAQLAREAAKTTPAPEPEAPADGNKQPDLTELSRDLPSGWQAYWDESSKQVYYGNTLTSATTWTKPTK